MSRRRMKPDDRNEEQATQDMDSMHAGHGVENATIDPIGWLQMAEDLNTEELSLPGQRRSIQRTRHQ